VVQAGHAVARALEVSLHAAAVPDRLQGTQAGAGCQVGHAVSRLLCTDTDIERQRQRDRDIHTVELQYLVSGDQCVLL